MRKMKKSNIRWMGEIPTTWVTKSIKYSFNIVSGATPKSEVPEYWDGDIPWITPADYKTKDKYVSGGSRNITKEGFVSCSTSFIPKGSIIFSKRAPIGTVAINNEVICTNQGCLSCIPKNEGIYVPYFYYAMWAADEHFELMGSGTTFKEISADSFANVKLPAPPLEEQHRISLFLDEKCGKIDELLDIIQRQLDTLEQYKKSTITESITKGLNPKTVFKDSGVQWIGAMPSHWNCIRGKYVLRYIQKPTNEDDGVITCFRDGEVTLRSNRREDGFTMAEKEIGYQGIDVGDLVVHGMDGFAGAIGISDSRGKASPVLNVLETNQNKRYIMYYLRSMAYSDVFLALATGIRVRSCDLRWNKLAELRYPIPPIKEQDEIVQYIDNIIKKTDEIIHEKKQEMNTLVHLKKSLIYEYVTGKKEVPES